MDEVWDCCGHKINIFKIKQQSEVEIWEKWSKKKTIVDVEIFEQD
jgi:hypothetical protein